MFLRRKAAGLAVVVALALIGARPALAAPPINHVFIIVLENKGFAETFGPGSPAPYLAQTLTAKGQLLTNYYGTGHVSLDNYVAMVSGQGPNVMTQSDCQIYADFLGVYVPGTPDGQAIGQGCVYPANVPTLVDQLENDGKTWKGYMQSMGTPCRHPALNSRDTTESATMAPGGEYASRHNPFNYFHSIIDDSQRCNTHVVPLEDNLVADLAIGASTPNYVFITPDLCEDGHDAPCVDGRPGGLVSADAFLRTWVPKILDSPAFQNDNGLLLVMFDESDVGASGVDSASCCGEGPGLNSPLPGITGFGGGRMGAVAISKFIRAGSVNGSNYNHYSLVRSIEDLFGLDHIGYAAAAGLQAFGDDVFNNP